MDSDQGGQSKRFPFETRMHHHELSFENLVTHKIQLLTQTKAGFLSFGSTIAFLPSCVIRLASYQGLVMSLGRVEVHNLLYIQSCTPIFLFGLC